MNKMPIQSFLSALFALLLSAPVTVAQAPPAAAGGIEGFGQAMSYRQALALALEDAVGKANGVTIAKGPSLRSRLAVVVAAPAGRREQWFDGRGDGESAWVQQQVAGFVRSYEVTRRLQGDDGGWQVTVRAEVLDPDEIDAGLVIRLEDNDLRSWQLERFEAGGAGRPFDRREGAFQGPRIGAYLARSGVIEIQSDGPGVQVTSRSGGAERAKARHERVASHRVVVDWRPIRLQSTVEKRNKARPTNGPRREFLTGGSVDVTVRVEDLVGRTVLLDENFAVTADEPDAFGVDRRDAFVTALVDKAKAEVARKIFFALRPPVVVRKWVGDGGAWFVEARISKRVAAGFERFVVGNDGSLADPDWQPLGAARLVGGNALTSTFELVDVRDPARVQTEVSQIRPIR